MKGRAWLLMILFFGASFSGCFGEETSSDDSDQTTYPSIWDRHTLEWNTTGTYSMILEQGPHTALPVQEAMISVGKSFTSIIP